MDKFEKGTGIVCEYNPFHKGHAYQIKKLREEGASFIVCAMSGDFVQRAEPAFQDKSVRAENAVRNGADIVLEIPFPFSSMSAEGFARAGISILENSGLCSSFGFGSECADIEKLKSITQLLDARFHKKVLALQKENSNLAYALARQKLIGELLGKEYAEIASQPNDILAIEYLKANKGMCPIPIKRSTPRGGFDENFASSSYIRKCYCDGEKQGFAINSIPENCILDGISVGDEMFYNHLLLSLMQKTPKELSGIAEVACGSEYSIIKNALKAENFDELCRLLASKTMTDAKVRRMLLFALFNIGKNMEKESPLYTQVLASSELGNKMLKKYRQDAVITVASRVADIKKNDAAVRQYNISRLAGEVLEKCRRIKD